MNFKMQSISWEKENWDGVHQNVKNAFQVVSNNTGRVQTWAEQVQEVCVQLEGESTQLKSSSDMALKSIKETKGQLMELTREVSSMRETARREFDTSHACTKRLLEVTRSFMNFFVQSVFHGSAVSDCDAAVDNTEPIGATLWESESDALGVLEHLSGRLCNQHGQLNGAFDAWNQWRASKDTQDVLLSDKSEELCQANDNARRRMTLWREMLKENSNVTNSLNFGLEEVRRGIMTLHSTQVSQKDLDEAILQMAEGSKELRELAERRVHDMGAKLDFSVAEVDKNIRNSEALVAEKVFDLKSDVKKLLEQRLNPVSAYLNTMNVETSTLRMELNQLQANVPELQNRLQEVSAQLCLCEERDQDQNRQLDVRLVDLSNESRSGTQKSERDLGDLQSDITQLRHNLAGHLEQLHKAIADNAGELETIRHGDLPKVCREFLSLEQKVAKWVRNEPMPGKINEARLYALESRLAQEMESRLQFEDSQRHVQLSTSERMSTFSNFPSIAGGSLPGMGVTLPTLSRHTPRDHDGAMTARSHASFKARHSARTAELADCRKPTPPEPPPHSTFGAVSYKSNPMNT